jgi:hypothetical protein
MDPQQASQEYNNVLQGFGATLILVSSSTIKYQVPSTASPCTTDVTLQHIFMLLHGTEKFKNNNFKVRTKF